jgi:hypothetical protein
MRSRSRRDRSIRYRPRPAQRGQGTQMTMTLVDFLTSNAVSALLFLYNCSPPGIAGRPDQSSTEPGASFQFGRTSMRRPRAPHLAHTTLPGKTTAPECHRDTSIRRSASDGGGPGGWDFSLPISVGSEASP